MFKVIKAGKLANGVELGKGSIIHLSENSYCGPAVCGACPKISWSITNNLESTCKQCTRIFSLAQKLILDLSNEGLEHYIISNEYMITAALKYGRKPNKYKIYVAAGKLAKVLKEFSE